MKTNEKSTNFDGSSVNNIIVKFDAKVKFFKSYWGSNYIYYK